jgi:hypothetical protein
VESGLVFKKSEKIFSVANYRKGKIRKKEKSEKENVLRL